jgi:outer membrane protein OmpA-like peptidoglycan-associated protein
MRPLCAFALLFALSAARADTVVPGDKKVPRASSKADRDGDGVPDSIDRCPDDPEDHDGFQDEDGCPDLDNDGDGIQDVDDLCPNEPEDRDGFEDADGCPDPDNDHDRIPDAVDKCPNEPETYNGKEDEDGCPDKCVLIIHSDPIRILDQLHFSPDGATIPPSAYPILDAIAATLNGNPQLTKIEVQGHADRGEAPSVAQARALAVMRYLVDKGVDAKRLRANGYGATRPLTNSPKERDKNRRVEFVILDRAQDI